MDAHSEVNLITGVVQNKKEKINKNRKKVEKGPEDNSMEHMLCIQRSMVGGGVGGGEEDWREQIRSYLELYSGYSWLCAQK